MPRILLTSLAFALPGAPSIAMAAPDTAPSYTLREARAELSPASADGALAAIQGLNAKLEAERDALKAENAELRERMLRIEQRLDTRE